MIPFHSLTHSLTRPSLPPPLTHLAPYSQDSLDEAVHSLHEQIKAGALTLDRGRFPRAALQLLREHGVADPHQPGTYISLRMHTHVTCTCTCTCACACHVHYAYNMSTYMHMHMHMHMCMCMCMCMCMSRAHAHALVETHVCANSRSTQHIYMYERAAT